ncbi:NepR family anti-sigma factor [Brevundimonas bullata]|uniref:anti-sigma T factor NepR n=1 Tax=Brevundimonas bullata TaxID=13160 RepID=UPI002FDB6608
MINTKETNPRPDAPASRDQGLEDVRLRQQAIGVKLRHMFDQVVNEPVPDEFLDILRRADERSSTKEGQ